MATFADLMSETAAVLGIEALEPDAEGVCEIISEEADIVLMDCPDADGTVLVTAKIADAPASDGDDALLAALEANHRLAATLGAAVALDPDDDSLMLSLYRPLDTLDGEKMVALLEAFTAELLSLRETCYN